MFEFGFVRAKLDSIGRLHVADTLTLLGAELPQQLLRYNYAGRVPDRNELQWLVHTPVITSKLWTDKGAPLGSIGNRLI